jgi:hypothetical protein
MFGVLSEFHARGTLFALSMSHASSAFLCAVVDPGPCMLELGEQRLELSGQFGRRSAGWERWLWNGRERQRIDGHLGHWRNGWEWWHRSKWEWRRVRGHRRVERRRGRRSVMRINAMRGWQRVRSSVLRRSATTMHAQDRRLVSPRVDRRGQLLPTAALHAAPAVLHGHAARRLLDERERLHADLRVNFRVAGRPKSLVAAQHNEQTEIAIALRIAHAPWVADESIV